MSSIEENKIIAQQWFKFISEHRIEDICEITAPTWKIHGALPGLPLGPEGVRKLFGSFGPIQQKWTIEDVIAEGDKVVVRATNTCIQDSFLGIPGRDRQQTFTATFIHYIADGKIIETWRNADDLGRVLQLGARIEPGISE
ncbi:MAG: ester cyclase [Nostoc sp. DedVER02]|uniref:ester cyclase n=1 Tax=unclassified Nostoc TaxID=2593658 RepID=UPI002AD3624D|nr:MULTISPECIES: nuclear transport factor 2 family protein [unclassified Nostoc]MDZ7985694.1 ester cyclase [Nostoc sp. DedVER02]MDZ8111351.1 ester cyclase [Nostoc sp. DedVER01b]